MKKLLLIGFSVLALNACDTISNIKMPEMSSLNPFNGTTQTVSKQRPSTPQTSSSALETEMAEMQKLTGNVMHYDAAPVTEDAAAPTEMEPATDTMMPEAQTSGAPTPANKPNFAKAAPAPQTVEITEAPQVEAVPVEAVEAEPVTDESIAPQTTPMVANEPVPAPAPAPASAPVAEQVVEPMNAVAPTETTTNDTAMYNDQDLKLSSAEGCPKVEIFPAGRSITYFENEMSGQMVARAVINEIKGGCEVVNGGMEIDLDIIMNGKIGDKGRFEGNKDMEAFMTFPYFVAVSNAQGLPVDKKILATAMRFKPVIDDLLHAEKITQFIPMDNVKEAANYRILVGFQLNRKQLEYNRGTNLNRVDNVFVAPDLTSKNRSRLSTNPLED